MPHAAVPFVPVPVPPPAHDIVPYYGGVPVGPVTQLPPVVQVRPITAANLDAQADLIHSLLPRFPFVAVDTEYPGTVHRPAAGRRDGQVTADERYALVKANVDELPIVQLGMTLCDDQGRLPVVLDEQGCPVELAWEVNFSDFDVHRDRHSAESVAFLRSQGVDFDLARAIGVSSAAFRDKLLCFLSRRRDELTWAAFGGLYDLGYLVKLLTGGKPLPATREEFMAQVRAHLGGRVFDAKYMTEHCGRGDLRGVGLKRVATNLGVPLLQFPEPPYLAGPKSFLASRVFTVMRRCIFHRDGGASHEGLIDGLQ